jgi:hypothetical protein
VSVRPELGKTITLEEFKRNYWKKEELVSFCRKNKLPIGGGKMDIAGRIEEYIWKGKTANKEKSRKISSAKSTMPKSFTRKTVIGRGWHCSQELRFFFEEEVGRSFHFNATMREFIRHGDGKTLEEAIAVYQKEKLTPRGNGIIAPQFEYNQHIRDYFGKHKGATLADAIKAWHNRKEERTKE